MPHKFLGHKYIQEIKFAVVHDRSSQYDITSVTNSVEEISDELNTQGILYLDSEEIWDAWIEDFGFISLGAAQQHIAEDSLAESIRSLKAVGAIEPCSLEIRQHEDDEELR